MAGRKQLELKPAKELKVRTPKKIRTIQTLRFGTSKVDLKLARKTLREMMREQKEHAATK